MKCICFIIKQIMCEVVSKMLKNTLFPQKTHCFPPCALFYPIVLKRKIITAYMHLVYASYPKLLEENLYFSNFIHAFNE